MYMRKTNNIFLNTFLCILAAVSSVSCLMEKDGPSADRQSVMIQLSVSVGDEMTKLTVLPDEEATTDEKVINTLRVYAFYGERQAGYVSRQATALNDPFLMDLELPESGIHNVDFYVIANEGEMAYENGTVQLTENMTRAQLEAIRFTGLVHSSALPMYCRLTEPIDVDAVSAVANTEAGHNGHLMLNQSIKFELSRSLAKLSVYAAKSAGAVSTPQIMRITLLNGGTRHFSYLFEQDASTLDAITPRVNDRALSTSAVSVTNELTKGTPDMLDPSKYTPIMTGAYLSEVREGSSVWNLSSGNPRAAVLNVEYTVAAGDAYRYANVFLPPIERNTHYKVCIFINAEGQIIINYVVADWEDNSVAISFDYPNHSFIRESIPVTPEDLEDVPSAPATMSETVPFTGYFQLKSPASDSWKPTIYGAHASDCDIEVYEVTSDTDPGTLVTGYPIPASEDKWYRIKVMPKPGKMFLNEEIKLSVTYEVTLTGLLEYLLVNGAKDKFYWPYTGSSAQDANYVIITMVN